MTARVIFLLFSFLWRASHTDSCYCGRPPRYIPGLLFAQLKLGRCAQREIPPSHDVTWYHVTLVTSSSVQPPPLRTSRGAISGGVTRSLRQSVTPSTSGIRIMPDIFKHLLTHISSIPKGGVEWLLVMLEQVLDISKAFNLEDLGFLLDDLPETNSQSDQTSACTCSLGVASQLKWLNTSFKNI